MDVSVIIATHGDEIWPEFARARAIPSAERQTVRPREILSVHGGGPLHEARNVGAVEAEGEWLCFLDADDELDPGYLAAMAQVDLAGEQLLAPAVLWLRDGQPSRPQILNDRDIAVMNPCVIGTLVRRSLFFDVGAFWDWPAWEDWCLFRRCSLAGAEIVHVADAVYRAHVRDDGRNAAHAGDHRLHRQITESHVRWQRERAA